MALMNLDRWPMRASLLIIILVLGVLGVMMSLVTGEIYRDLILDNQRKGLAQIIDAEIDERLRNITGQVNEFALSVQASQGFRDAFHTAQREHIEAAMGQHFDSYFTNTANLAAEQFRIFDSEQRLLAVATDKSSPLAAVDGACVEQVAQAAGRSGSERIKPLAAFCRAAERLLLSAIVPIGGVRLSGYMQVLIDPVPSLAEIESKMGMPVMMVYSNRQTAYRSPAWPKHALTDNTAISEHALKDAAGNPLLSISFAFDVNNLHQKLANTKALLLLGALLVTLLAMVLALMLLQKTALLPLARLTQYLQLAREDRTHLNEGLEISGNKEVTALASHFNAVIGELHDAYQEVEKLAFTDMLTGLPNRDLFYDRLNQMIIQGRRQSSRFCLFVMDLDRFKYINDTLGHHVGDELLRQAAGRIQAAVRETDTIARLGGDEFAALLPRVIDTQGALIVAERIHDAFSAPFQIDERQFQVTVSIGMVMYPYHGDDLNQLIQRADVAMYHAKQHHLGYIFYEAEIDKHNVMELTLETELKHAIENNGLKLFYQPKIIIETGEVYGVEALVRWIHPERGFIPPDSFIPMAEQTGMIHPLTYWVLGTALRQAKAWHDRGLMLNVAVNLSAHSLRDPHLVSLIEIALKEAEVAPEYLTLELTEGAVMSDPKRALDILSALDEKGVMLSIDDFGTGYSSLSYLKQLPMDEIKIDRSFVMEMDNDKNDEVIVHSTIDLAHNMGLRVIAEGIETEQSWNTLRSLGCDVGQGYFMCKPTDAESLTAWLDSAPWKVVRSA